MKKEGLPFGEKTIETPTLLIKKNIMAWNDTMIQLSNISYVSSSDVAQLSFPGLAAIMIIVAIILLGKATFPAIILAVIGVLWIYYWYQENEKRKKCAVLTIRMNSGNNLYFAFSDKTFLTKVMNVLAYIIINGTDRQVSISIKNCEISGNAQVLTDGIFG